MTGDGALRPAGANCAAVAPRRPGRTRRSSARTGSRGEATGGIQHEWRFNRAVRMLVASPRGVSGAAVAATVAPAIFESIIRCPAIARIPDPGSDPPDRVPSLAIASVTVALPRSRPAKPCCRRSTSAAQVKGRDRPPDDVIDKMRWAYPLSFVVMGVEGP